jgi:HEXXH motif-containing protein
MSDYPWCWRPDKTGWHSYLRSAVASRRFAAELEIDSARLRRALCEAAERQEPWLFHPCLHVVTLGSESTVEGDFRLAFWAARHSPVCLGRVTVPWPIWAWSSDGGRLVDPGSYDLGDLAGFDGQNSWAAPIALDLWADSVGFPLPLPLSIPPEWVWPAHLPLSHVTQQEVEKQICTFLATIQFLFTRMPTCFEWVLSVTRVVLPLRSETETGFHSGSNPGLPGLVCLDLRVRDIQILEALVHESAHQHFHVANIDGPLVDPGYEGLHESPLRRDLRPLKGIFLAYHALVFMRLLYVECQNLGIDNLDEEVAKLNQLANTAGQTLDRNQRHLTEYGLEFLEKTQKVSSYGHQCET